MCKSSDQFINILFSLIFYLVVKRLIITKNSVVEIRNLVNHDLRPVKSNLEEQKIYLCNDFLYGTKMDIKYVDLHSPLENGLAKITESS